jgi:hypothetical protein
MLGEIAQRNSKTSISEFAVSLYTRTAGEDDHIHHQNRPEVVAVNAKKKNYTSIYRYWETETASQTENTDGVKQKQLLETRWEQKIAST